MASFTCRFCNQVMSLTPATYQSRYPSFDSVSKSNTAVDYRSTLRIDFYECPSCNNTSIILNGIGRDVKGLSMPIHPRSTAIQYPDYIPEKIRRDYEEAYLIAHLSPKASATLARRCLQGIIHDFWGIKLKNLNHEITALKDKIQPDLWSAIDSLRQLGNIGAHMEKDINTIVDIDSGEAEKLLKLIELLMKEWYISREERNQLFSDILSINAEKQDQRTQQG